MRRLALISAALLGLASPAFAGTMSLLSGSQYSEPSQVLATVNTVINSINANVANSGAGALGSAIYVPSVTNAVNALSITPGATTVAPILSVGDSLGKVSDTNIGIVIAGKGTGKACLGGSTCANTSLEAVNTASAVNHVVVTGQATGTAPTIAVGGTGADTNVNLSVAAAGTGIVRLGQTISTCSGTTTATCQGQRFIASVTGLTTAAGAESAAMTVTNASVVSSSSTVICNVNIYAGTGMPLIGRITPGTGTVSFVVTNVAGSGSLNATVPVHCIVTN